MPSDPGFARDNCIYSEAISGDGGNHNASATWWLSPDISLIGPTSGPDKADPGQINPVTVRFHRKSGNCEFSDSESLSVELWVGNPAIAMTPNNPQSTTQIGFLGSPLPQPGAAGIQSFQWTPPTGVSPTNPQSPGHKCLIARAYPDNLTPSADNFFLPDDQHVVQRNLCIVPCGGPGAAKAAGPCGLQVTTVNPSSQKDQVVTINITQDREPDSFVRRTVLKSLQQMKGFKALSTRRVDEFGFDSFERADVKVVSGSSGGYEGRLHLAASQVTRSTFSADLSGGEFGDAYIFHLTQTGADGNMHGGLTVVLVL